MYDIVRILIAESYKQTKNKQNIKKYFSFFLLFSLVNRYDIMITSKEWEICQVLDAPIITGERTVD
jgi:hypothetical protein